MARITIDIPDEGKDLDSLVWMVARAVLNAVEPGSSDHCLRVGWSPDGMTGYRHERLGVTIAAEGTTV